MISDLVVCREMHWTLDELLVVPVDQYSILIDWLNEQWHHARIRE